MRRGRGRAEESLDPVRRGPVRRSAAVRAAMVTVLVGAAAAVVWSGGREAERPAGRARAPTSAAASGLIAAAVTTAPAGSPAGRAASAPAATHQAADSGRADRLGVPAGLVGVSVRLADPTGLPLIAPGDRVDLLRMEAGGKTHPVARNALVLGVTGPDDPLTGGLLLALDPRAAGRAVASPEHGYAVLLRPG